MNKEVINAQSIFQDFLTLLFPNCCAGCQKALEKNEELICVECRANLPKTNFHQYGDQRVAQKFIGKISLRNAFAYLQFNKEGITQSILHELKYKNNQEVGELLARYFAQEIKELVSEIEFIVPVPLHHSKKLQRGYNQCDPIAKGFSQILEVPFAPDALIRNKATISQTRKSRSERQENVSNIFSVSDANIFKDKHILLVDDVLTTGATLEACAIPILEANCASLTIAVLATA
ncbi:MAG: ComF family protein [Bacteroidetes bacterium]|nr:MAG: ComF family protein [Bacteroidota bacterium]